MATSDCPFCRILARELEASVVYEDDATLAFMDLRQPSAAHVLVIPKIHVETVFELEPDTAARLMQATVLVARAVRTSLKPAGVNLWQSNGHAAGQEVPHVHMHILARSVGDSLLQIYPARPRQPARADLDALAATIRSGFADPKAAPARNASAAPVRPDRLRQRMRAVAKAAQRRWAGSGDERPLDERAQRLLEPARAALQAGQGEAALALLDAVTSEYMTAWHDLQEWTETGETFLTVAAGLWTEAITRAGPELSHKQLQDWRDKLAAWHEAVEDFGQDGPFAAAIAAATREDSA